MVVAGPKRKHETAFVEQLAASLQADYSVDLPEAELRRQFDQAVASLPGSKLKTSLLKRAGAHTAALVALLKPQPAPAKKKPKRRSNRAKDASFADPEAEAGPAELPGLAAATLGNHAAAGRLPMALAMQAGFIAGGHEAAARAALALGDPADQPAAYRRAFEGLAVSPAAPALAAELCLGYSRWAVQAGDSEAVRHAAMLAAVHLASSPAVLQRLVLDPEFPADAPGMAGLVTSVQAGPVEAEAYKGLLQLQLRLEERGALLAVRQHSQQLIGSAELPSKLEQWLTDHPTRGLDQEEPEELFGQYLAEHQPEDEGGFFIDVAGAGLAQATRELEEEPQQAEDGQLSDEIEDGLAEIGQD